LPLLFSLPGANVTEQLALVYVGAAATACLYIFYRVDSKG